MTGRLLCFIVLIGLFVFVGCGSKEEAAEQPAEKETQEVASDEREEPQYVKVQHILIGFDGSLPGRKITRTREQAAELAAELLEKAKAGEDFDALVKEYTDDSHPGIYKMANHGLAADRAGGVFSRGGMVRGFGDVGFSLGVGEIGMASYDPTTSPYGWHIIKRLE
ncbi:MAG: peptidylprolyl isomerase [Candidatus Latescibacterota bacterium]|nr:MAG: peptidylprolyl isomerase [Candidatus Latescibacterota bacterium]